MSSRLQQTLGRLFAILALSCSITPALYAQPDTQKAIFAGGCFWCMEPPFDALDGVISTTSGYIGGTVVEPTYNQVSSGKTGHTEALQIIYNPDQITYEELLAIFWKNIDPTDGGGQFCDRGSQYRSEVFYTSNQQRGLAAKSKQQLNASAVLPAPVQTAITAASPFYSAEDYHQNYYQKNPKRYKFYSWNCGRAQRLLRLWGKPYDSH